MSGGEAKEACNLDVECRDRVFPLTLRHVQLQGRPRTSVVVGRSFRMEIKDVGFDDCVLAILRTSSVGYRIPPGS